MNRYIYIFLSKTPCGLAPLSPVPLWTIFFGEPRCGTPPKKHEKLTPEPNKNRRPERVWEGLGAVSEAILGHFGSKLCWEAALAIFGRPWKGQDGAKMDPKGAKMGQEAPRSTQEGLLGAMLGASWPIWEAFWGHLGEKTAKQRTFKNYMFTEVFATLGESRWGS